MAQASGALETREHALEACELSYIVSPAKPFFTLEARSPQTATGYVAAPKSTLAGKRGPDLQGTWQHQSFSRQGGEVRNLGTHGCVGVCFGMEARSGATGHVAALESTSLER
jgi:hypothetical protein